MKTGAVFPSFFEQITYRGFCLRQISFEGGQELVGRGLCKFSQLSANAPPKAYLATPFEQPMAGAIDPALGSPTGITSRIVPTEHCGMQQPASETISQMARVRAALAVNVGHPALLGSEFEAWVRFEKNVTRRFQEHFKLARRERRFQLFPCRRPRVSFPHRSGAADQRRRA